MSEVAQFPAVLIVHWPGRDTPCCTEHARQLQALNDFLGGPVLAGTPCGPEVECANCRNEHVSEDG